MTERQYILQHILHLSAARRDAKTDGERENIDQALLFYAHELEKIEREQRREYIQ